MAQDIADHFIEQFNAELYEAFQHKGDVMRPRLRRKAGVVGYRTHFPKIGTAPTAMQKTRNGKVPLMELLRDRVYCDLADWYAADLVDKLDELKTNVEERGAIIRAISWSLARKEDAIASAMLVTGSNAGDNTSTDDAFTTDAVPKLMLATFGDNNAIEGAGDMHAIVTWTTWSALLGLDSFINSDFGGATELTREGMRPKQYFGFNYMPWSEAPLHSGGTPYNLWFNKNCAGMASGKEVTTETHYLPEYAAHMMTGMMSLGAVLIDDTGVIKRRYGS